MITCILTPYDIAFSRKESWVIIIIDIIFLVDMMITFNTAFYDSSINLISDRKKIGIAYLKGWFFMDLFSILPYNLLLK
jgi:hypothetical protein